MAFNILATADFVSNDGQEYQIEIFTPREVNDIVDFSHLGADGFVIEHKSEEDDIFWRISSSRCTVPFIVNSDETFDVLQEIYTNFQEDYYLKISEDIDGVIFQGKILQDLGQYPNKPRPFQWNLVAVDGLNSLESFTADELIIPADGNISNQFILTVFPYSLPTIFIRALKLLDIEEYGDIKLRSSLDWTNPATRGSGHSPDRNYFALYGLRAREAFLNTQETEERLKKEALSPSLRPIIQRVEFTKNTYHDVKTVLLGILECLDMKLFYDRGVYYVINANNFTTSSLRLWEYDGNYTPNYADTNNYGATPLGIVGNEIQLPNDAEVYANGVYNFDPAARKITHFWPYHSLVNQYEEGAIFLQKSTATSSNNFESVTLAQINEDSFNFADLTFKLNGELFRLLPSNDKNYSSMSFEVFATIQCDGLFLKDDEWQSSIFLTSIYASIGEKGSLDENGHYFKQFSFEKLLQINTPPPNESFEDLNISIYARSIYYRNTGSGTALTPIVREIFPGKDGTDMWGFVRGDVVLGLRSSDALDNNGYLIDSSIDGNEKSSYIAKRPNLLYNNAPESSDFYQISSFDIEEPGFIFGFQPDWRKGGSPPDLLLNDLRSREMGDVVKNPQQRLSIEFRRYSQFRNVHTFDGVRFHWLNRKFRAKTNAVSGVGIEYSSPGATTTGTTTTLGLSVGETLLLSSGSGGVDQFGGSIASGNVFTGEIDAVLDAGQEYEEVTFTNGGIFLPSGSWVSVLNDAGSVSGSFQLIEAVMPGQSGTFMTEAFEVINDIAEGSGLMVNTSSIFSALWENNVRAVTDSNDTGIIIPSELIDPDDIHTGQFYATVEGDEVFIASLANEDEGVQWAGGEGNYYVRSKENSTWGAWKALATTGDLGIPNSALNDYCDLDVGDLRQIIDDFYCRVNDDEGEFYVTLTARSFVVGSGNAGIIIRNVQVSSGGEVERIFLDFLTLDDIPRLPASKLSVNPYGAKEW